MGKWQLLLILAAGAFATGCGGDEAGRKVFHEAGCVGCHTLADAGATARVGPNLDEVRPDADKVMRQVQHGGNGMPSFAGQLTKDQIESVAKYVSDVAGKSGRTVSAAFTPDDATIASCRDRDDYTRCLEQPLGNIIYRRGTKAGVAELTRLVASDERVAGDCHRIAHAMGGAALARERGKVGKAMVGASSICASGYYHGVVERAFTGVSKFQLQGKAREMCSDPQVTRSPFVNFQCLHGLGHGLMLHTAYDLPESLRVCESLGSFFATNSCLGGAFMENFVASYDIKSPWVKKDDPIYPCNSVKESQKLECYIIVVANIIKQVGSNWTVVAQTCRRSEPKWVKVCFQSIGREISGWTVHHPRKAIEYCGVSREFFGDCIFGLVRDIVNTDAAPQRAVEVCRLVDTEYKRVCYRGIGAILLSLEPGFSERRATCIRIAPHYADACIEGGALPTLDLT